MARRQYEIDSKVDVTCEQCEQQRKRGAKRPTCEECGKIDLGDENRFLWWIFCEHHSMLFGTNGMGGFWLQGDQVKMICGELNIDCDQIYHVSKRLTRIMSIVSKGYQPEDQKE